MNPLRMMRVLLPDSSTPFRQARGAPPRAGSGAEMISRRAAVMGGAVAVCALARNSLAQTRYPSRPVRLVVPFAAGTSPDVVARLWGERFAKSIGQAIVVENRPGAATIIAAQAVAGAPADGYTLFWTVNNTFSINPFVYRKLPYSIEDFVPITRILSVPFVLLVSAASHLRTLEDLVRAAKTSPTGLTYASPGIGTSPHVVMARLLNVASVTMTHVPYKEHFIPDVIAQRIDAAFDATTTAIGYIQGGKVRPLAISSANRVDALKDIPVIGDTYPGFVGESWHGVFAPKGTPADIVNTIAKHSQGVVDAPDFRNTLASRGLVPVGSSPASFREFLLDDAKAWGQVIRANQITVE